jgi:hypothetical protein
LSLSSSQLLEVGHISEEVGSELVENGIEDSASLLGTKLKILGWDATVRTLGMPVFIRLILPPAVPAIMLFAAELDARFIFRLQQQRTLIGLFVTEVSSVVLNSG